MLFTPQLSVAGGGATSDIEATFALPPGAGSFGISVLADNATLLHSAVIQINISAPDAATGSRVVTASGGILRIEYAGSIHHFKYRIAMYCELQYKWPNVFRSFLLKMQKECRKHPSKV